jgi:exosortase
MPAAIEHHSKSAVEESSSQPNRALNAASLTMQPPKFNASKVVGWLLVGGLIAASYFSTLKVLWTTWSNEADYSHGFFVPVFAAFLLWQRRKYLPTENVAGNWGGLALLVLSAIVRCVAVYVSSRLIDAFTIPLTLAGLAMLIGGWPAIRYSWPAIFFLWFMVPLPSAVSELLSAPLQRIATVSSVYVLQTIGVSAVAQGNIIWLATGKIGVVEACSGLRMLTLFLAICVGACFLVRRSPWEKAFIVFSALPIGIAANIVRITATGVLFETVGREFAERVFHDFAGWLLMPLAMLLLGLELVVLSHLFIEAEADEIRKLNLRKAASERG